MSKDRFTTTHTTPAFDQSVNMSAYAWTISPAITSGKHTIKLTNSATQPHEMFVLQLAPERRQRVRAPMCDGA